MTWRMNYAHTQVIEGSVNNGVEAILYCQLEGAVGDETVTLARQQGKH